MLYFIFAHIVEVGKPSWWRFHAVIIDTKLQFTFILHKKNPISFVIIQFISLFSAIYLLLFTFFLNLFGGNRNFP